MTDEDARYVLITQCLQNDFLRNRGCRLYVGDVGARRLLAGADAAPRPQAGARLDLEHRELERGPLGVFLDATIGRRLRGGDGDGVLHVINIRDWHEPGPTYDLERRAYGAHCAAGTWGASFVEGLAPLLDPTGAPEGAQATDFAAPQLRIHHVYSDSIFDFRPRREETGPLAKFPAARLERLLDELVVGTDSDDTCEQRVPLHVAVVGVFTDIKVLILLAGLRTRYDLHNLAVSDTLTASATLERHIAGLDFVDKLLGVEVFHGVNDLAAFLGSAPPLEDESALVGRDAFGRYRSYFQDKQAVLAAESERLRDYVALTESRALATYGWIRLANYTLLGWGTLFLAATLVFAVLSGAGVAHFTWRLSAVTGGVSLLQLVSAFYSKPINDLQRNLANLAVFKMVLESRSLKSAIARFHLTTPHTLRDLQSQPEADAARLQVELLERELRLIEEGDAIDFEALARLGFADSGDAGGMDGTGTKGEPAPAGGD